MDVIEPDDRPTETGTSAKLTNGNTTSAEENTMAAVASGAGRRKKAKRKNKAKNSLAEPEMTGETSMTISGSTDTAMTKALKAVLAKEMQQNTTVSVHSNCNRNSSNHSSSHSNGLPEEPVTSVDAISKKLEQCVQIGRNGLTHNGLPKRGASSLPDAGSAPSEETSGAGTSMDKSTAGRKKHRSRQTKKGPTNTTCIESGNEENEEGVKSQPTSTALPGLIAREQGEPGDVTVLRSATEPTGDCVPSTSKTSLPTGGESKPALTPMEIAYQVYESERQMPSIMALIQKDLSEPYSIYTYRYFIHNWPKLCFLALHRDTCVGAIVCKLDIHRQETRRGYIAMLAVDKDYRKLKIGTTLVQRAIQAMLEDNADEVVLETEITNQPALRLYENLGFVRDKRLFHYYLNGVDALRLKLWFR
ncbi:N-alpha-acetyltransferase 30A-like [Anopheles moucheti]|uniref:N-alpha-acetyltransferase 30A-like n=1 Tax=Anopheles moucheti TaxID=186751 RepID=UPI0022EFFB52|nr:N-alpha-acetyltransferase 30A-like [Anopheles moucheti]XP_052901812.1 N-alpha-acetyltransferase 30A-like [Anopheles moucheti]